METVKEKQEEMSDKNNKIYKSISDTLIFSLKDHTENECVIIKMSICLGKRH